MTQPDREKVLNKIAKLKRLASSTEPHEAAAALRQMQKMMELHQITDAEMAGVEVRNAQAKFKERRGVAIPLHYSIMCNMLDRALGVTHVFDDRDQNKDGERLRHDRLSVRYFGLPGRPEMAVHAHSVMLKAMRKAWDDKLKSDPDFKRRHSFGAYGKNARQAFYLGWLDQVQEQVTSYGFSQEEAKALSAAKEVFYGKSLIRAKTRNTNFSSNAMVEGQKAGETFNLHRPIHGDNRRLGHE